MAHRNRGQYSAPHALFSSRLPFVLPVVLLIALQRFRLSIHAVGNRRQSHHQPVKETNATHTEKHTLANVDKETAQKKGQPANIVRANRRTSRSEEHTSELQSQSNLVCRLLLEKK